MKFLLDKPPGLRKLDKKIDLCEMLDRGTAGRVILRYQGRVQLHRPIVTGHYEPEFESGKVGPKLGAYKDIRANRRIYQYLPKFPRDSVQYLAFAPLDKLAFDPDILIILVDSSQAEIFLRAKAYTKGEMWIARGTTVAGCAWLYIYPNFSGEMNLGITGVGMRARRLFPEGRLLITIPWDKLPGILKNLEEMEWVPESFNLGPEGHKKKVRKILKEIKRESEEAGTPAYIHR